MQAVHLLLGATVDFAQQVPPRFAMGEWLTTLGLADPLRCPFCGEGAFHLDPVCRPEASERIHRDVAASQLTPLTPAKHRGLLEQHPRFVELVRTFAFTRRQTALPSRPSPVNTS